MTKKIFSSICIAAISAFLASAVLFMGALYEYFSQAQMQQLRMQVNLAARGAAHDGISYFDGLDVANWRVTWIDADGTVLYDSKSDSAEMENHLEREEIKQALSNGTGESSRYSDTLSERSIYCAKRLPDGTVLRLSIGQEKPIVLFGRMQQPLCMIFGAVLILSITLALRLSKAIVKPFNELNLDNPLQNNNYDELAPLLDRIAKQQRQIRTQGEELRRSQSEFAAVTNGMAEGIVLLDSKNIILSMNPAAIRLFGTSPACVGKYLLSVNRSLELQKLLQKAGEGKYAEMIMELGGGSFQMDASPVIADGLVSGIVLLMLDVTEKEKAEQMRREFTANVSHELKTPLHTISGSAELMAEGMVKPEDIPKFSERIYAEAQRMICLVEDIIKLSRLDEGAGDMRREEVDLCALAEEAARTLLPKAQERGIAIYMEGRSGKRPVECAAECAAEQGTACASKDSAGGVAEITTAENTMENAMTDAVQIYGIRQLLSGIAFNLIDNAIKYNQKDGSVVISVKVEGKETVLSVADTGIGIPDEHKERIFERFYRVDKSHSKEIGGTGLGLSIVKHAAKLHDARIEVRSAQGSGTEIKVIFPGA